LNQSNHKLTTSQTSIEQITRKKAEFTTDQYRFNPVQKSFSDQFYSLYHTRLTKLSLKIQEKASAQWADVKRIPKIVHTKVGQSCFIIGTVFKEMPLKINALDEITREVIDC
jgi:DNA polymerase delta subunit 2